MRVLTSDVCSVMFETKILKKNTFQKCLKANKTKKDTQSKSNFGQEISYLNEGGRYFLI